MNKCILRSIIMMLFFVGQNVFAAGETEPNNAFETADKITQGETVTGNVGTSGDSYDFFVSTLKNEGTIKLYFSSTGLNEQADINFYVYSKNKSSIGAIAVNNKKSANDSLFIFCRADDTIYIRVNGSQSINYSFRYIVEEPAPNDVEPNNNFSEAVLISSNQLVKGRLGYSGTTSDNYDYFYSILPDDGTLRVYVDKVNTSNSADADFNLYVYNKNQGSIGSYSDNNKPVGELPTDTLDIFCVKGDTVYFRLNGGSGCFSYTMRYEMLSPPKGDIEPNNTFEEAVYIEEKEIVPGRIGYSNVGEDSYDYFYSVLPDDGTLRVYVDKVNTSNTANADFNLYVYNKKRGSIGSYSDNNTLVGELPTDTLDIFCVKGDTVYFRLNGGSGCYSYTFRYEMLSPPKGDIEPNNTFEEAVYFEQKDTVFGRVGYANVTGDSYDFFYSVLPDDGTLRVYVDKVNTSNTANADFNLYVYNKKRGSIGSYSDNNKPVGALPTDTLDIFCVKGDTVYFRLYGGSGCFSYTLRYEMLSPPKGDIEPNNTFEEAVYFEQKDTVFGRVGYANVTEDSYDFFYSVLPDDGTLRVYVDKVNTSNSDGADFNLYVYNKNKGVIGSYADNNKPVGALPTDTLDIFCLKGDTVYFRLYGGSGCYSYTLRYEMLSLTKGDIEPNNSFEEAVYFEQKDTVSGRVGYASVTEDSYDFFYSILPDDGALRVYVDKVNTSNSAGADFNLYVFNKNKGVIGSYADNNKPVGASPTDTLNIFCVKGDTVYFRIQGGTGCFSYTLRYEMLSTSKSDSEQNNTLETSILISLSDTLIGNIGHANGAFDNYDYFKFVNDKRSTITAYFTYNNTSNSTGADLGFSFLNKSGSALLTKSYNNQALGIQKDTIIFKCAPTDTLLLRLSASACFNYSLKFEIKEEQPEAEILSARTGNDFGFIANTSHEDWIEWDFGNGVKSNFKYPSQSFDIGVYDVVLSARNTRCNIIKKDTLVIEVKGIESYMPQKSGEGGDFTMNIYGGGLDENTKITLTNGGSVLSPISKNGNEKRNLLLAEFDLHSADAGVYDVTIEIPGEEPIIFPNGFQIEPIKYPVCKAEVSGPDTWRINRETNFELKITNEGNINANGVAVGFVFPRSVSVSFIPKQARLPINGSTTIELDGEIITLPNSETSIFADSASVPIAITHLLGEPFDGYMIYFLLPKVPANSTVSIPFKANSETAGSPNFYTYTHQPNMFGSCQTEHWSNTTNMIMAEGIDFLDMTVGEKNLPAKVFTKSLKIGQKHLALSGAYMGAKFDAWWNGYEMTGEMYGILSAELDEANAYGLKTAGEEAASELLSLGVGKALSQNKLKNQWWNETMANNMHLTPEKFDNFLDKVNALEAGSARIRRLEAMLSTVKSLKTLEDKRQALVKLVEECPELKKQLKDLIDLLDEELNQKDPNDKKTRTVRSMDPNAIYGPEGILDPRFKRSENAMHYMITCENVDTASASAQVVTIVDTLNPEYFDLNTFSFGTVFIGNKVTRLLNFRTEFYGEVSLYPEIPLVARIIAKLDTITGVISWTFIGIDENGELPRDPFMGVLPPNTNPPFGEAGVNYTVRLRADVPNGTVITNVADIIFDENEPIRTNTWKNVVDIIPPTSTIRELAVENDTIIKLAFTGADDGSGVADYKVYVSTDNGEWTPVGAVADDSLTLVGEPGRNYRFYVSTRDLVGNNENKDPISEAEISIVTSISEKSNPLQAIRIYPNPNNGQLYFNYHTDLGNFRVTIFDMLGKAVLSRSVIGSTQQTERLDISELTNGMYIVSFRDEKGNESSEKFILMK